MKKRLLSGIICLALILTLLPAISGTAGAEGETPFYEGNAMHFADTNDSLSSPYLTNQLDDITMEAWVKADTLPASSGDTNIRVMYNGNSASTGYGIYIQNNKPCVLVGNVGFAVVSDVLLTTSKWYHLAAVRNSGAWTLYVNGTAYTPSNSTSAPNALEDTNTFTVGNSNVANENFTGCIDEVRFWTVVRTEQEIKDNMYIKLSGAEEDLLAYYNFDQEGITASGDNTSVTTVTDVASSGHPLAISGFALNGNTSNFVPSVALSTFELSDCLYRVKEDADSIVSPSTTISITPITKNVMYGTASVASPTASGESTVYDYIYFGNYGYTPIKWRVLDAANGNAVGETDSLSDGTNPVANSGAMLLLMDNLYYNDKLKSAYAEKTPRGAIRMIPYSYNSGGIKTTLHTKMTAMNADTSYFTSFEQASMLQTSMSDGEHKFPAGGDQTVIESHDDSNVLAGDKLFPLSVKEADSVSYFPNGNADRIAICDSTAGVWWLRSCAPTSKSAIKVAASGIFELSSCESKGGETADCKVEYYMRPAFNLNKSTVLFTSAADNSGHNTSFAAPAAYNGTEWKLTLKDGNDFETGTSITSDTTTFVAGYPACELKFSHKSLSSLSADYTNVTAALTDASGSILYYGSVNANTSETSSSVTIPAGLAEGDYTLSLYGEDRNAENETDYATGTPYTVTIKVTPPPTVTSVAVSPATANVEKGSTQEFTATVEGEHSPALGVTWSVEGGIAGTTIDGGNLTVAAGETAETLTVKATSTWDVTKSGTATVTVKTPTPTVTTTTSYDVTNAGATQELKLNVAGINGRSNITWTMSETDADNILTLPANVTGTLSNKTDLSLGNISVASNAPGQPAKSATVTISFTGGTDYTSLPDPIRVPFNLAKGAVPAAPPLTLDYGSEMITGVASGMEYVVDTSATAASWTDATAISSSAALDISEHIVANGETAKYIHIRVKAVGEGDSGVATDIALPARPAATDFAIDYATENTTAEVPATVEYNTVSATHSGDWTSCTGAVLALTPGTTAKTYYFRTAATESSFAGAVQTLSVPARPATPTGDNITAVSAIGTADLTTKLTFTYSSGSYEYLIVANGAVIAADAVWTPVPATGTAIDNIAERASTDDVYVRVMAGAENFKSGELQVLNTLAISKHTYPGTHAAPTVSSKTDVKVVLNAVTATDETVEYAKSTDISAPMTGWQDSPTFERLAAGNTYYFFARVKENADHYAGAASAALSVTTKTAPATPPAAATISTTANSITITGGTANPNCEYIITKDSTPTNWVQVLSPTDTSDWTLIYYPMGSETRMTSGTQYYLHYRVKATDSAMPSQIQTTSFYTLPTTPAAVASEDLVVTAKSVSIAAGKSNTTYEYAYTSNDATAAPDSGWVTGASAEIKLNTTDLTAATQYKVWVRVKAAGGVPASAASAPVTIYTLPATPDAVAGRYIKVTADSVTIDGGEGGNTTDKQYLVTLASVDKPAASATWITGTGESLTVGSSLTPETLYKVWVRVKANGDVPASDASASKYPFYTAYATPDADDYSIDEATNVITFNDTAYEVSKDFTSEDPSMIVLTGAELTPGTTYYIRRVASGSIPVSAALAFTCAKAELNAVTVTGTTSAGVSGTATITLTGTTFKTVAANTKWDTNVGGVKAKVTSAITTGAATATVTFCGTPEAPSDDPLTVTIPATALASNAELTTTSSETAKWDIRIPVAPRNTALDFSAPAISYKSAYGTEKAMVSTAVNITDSGEGWAWYAAAAGEGTGTTADNHPAKTLILDGANIVADAQYALEVPDDTTIFISGENSVESVDNGSQLFTAGIYGLGKLTIDGEADAVLTVVGGTTDNTDGCSMGIHCPNHRLIINSGTLHVIGGQAKNIVVGIYAAGFELNNGSVTATCGSSSAIACNGVNVTGASATYSSATPAEKTIDINGGSLTAIGGKGTDECHGIWSALPVNILGGTVRAKSNDPSKAAILVYYSFHLLTIGSTVKPAVILNGYAAADGNRLAESSGVIDGKALYSLDSDPVTILFNPTITVGEQTGTVKQGTAGSVTYAVFAANFASTLSTDNVKWYTTAACTTVGSAPTGVTASFASQTSLQMSAAANAAAGTYYFKVFSGEIYSEVKTLVIAPPTGGVSGGGAAPAPKVPVIVDGKEYAIGTAKTSGGITTVTIDQTELQKQLDSASETVVIPITRVGNANTVVTQLVVKNVDDMAQKEMTLSVQVDNVSYDLPAVAVDTASLLKELGATDPESVPVNVSIAQLSESDVNLEEGELVLPPVEFTVTASYGGRNTEIEVFEKYVQRVIEVPNSEDAGKITTAVVVENGKQRHVPTEVFSGGGKWYARINSLTNSTYALISNEKSFSDASGKWFEDVVNEMASRGVINGKAKGIFDGEGSITRAEFAAIIVRALGLPTDGECDFTDVKAGDWYYGAVGTAAKYGLVKGYDDGSFKPNANITRQEAMALIQRAAQLADFSSDNVSVQGFADLESVGAWALGAVNFNVANGLIVGSNGYIRPTDNITRAESATVVLRLLQKAKLVDVRAKA